MAFICLAKFFAYDIIILPIREERIMRIDILERGYKAKDKLKDLIEKKVNRFEKYVGEDASCKVVLSSRNDNSYKMEVTLTAKNLFVRSEVESDNMYVNIDTCLSKIERQIVKHQDKLSTAKKGGFIDPVELLFFDELPKFRKPVISKRKHYDLHPMSEAEAMEQLDLVDHDFYVFLNEKTQKVSVLYRRGDDDYGVIETNI